MQRARRELGAKRDDTLHYIGTYVVLLQKVGRYEEVGALSRVEVRVAG